MIVNVIIIEVFEYVVFSLEILVLSYFLFIDVFCLWDFGDNLFIFSGWLLVFMYGKVVMLYYYLFLGKFLIYIYCLNEVSRIVFNIIVMVLELIKLLMKVCFDCNYLIIIIDILYRKYFIFGDDVIFMIIF